MFCYIEYIIISIALFLTIKQNLRVKTTIGNRNISLLWGMTWLLFTFIAAFRTVDPLRKLGGTDTANYIDAFLNGTIYSSEKLFYALGNMIRIYTDDYHVYFLVIYGIIVFGILCYSTVLFENKISFPICFLYSYL